VSGVAGWLDFQRDLRDEALTVSRMAADLVSRGPREGGRWLDRHAALAQRTDAGRPESGAPAVLEENGRPVAAAVCDGYLHNTRELWAASGGGPVPSPAGVVLRAYLRWGADAAERLEGAFAFAVWDARREELLLGRDRLGIKPLSYAPTPAGAVFASDVATLAGHPLVTPELDAEGLSALLTQIRTPGHGVLRGVREVPPGCTVRFTRDGETPRRYWALQAQEHTLGRDDTVKHVRGLLEDCVARDMDGTDPGVLLSGGLDSSVLTGLAATGASRTAPRTFTVVFGGTAAAVPDRPFADEVVLLWGCEHREITVDPAELTDPVLQADALSAKDHPTPFGDKNVTPFLFSRRVAARTPVALSGEAADAMFGGLGGALDENRVLTTFPWIERSARFGMPYGIGTGLFDPGVLRSADVGGHLDRMFHQALAEVPHLPGASRLTRLANQVDHLTVTRLLEQTVGHSERLGTTAGLQVRFPFADHRLYSFLYNVPPELKSFDGREKSLLRAVATDLVPPSVLTRAKVPYPITYDARYKAELLQRLRTLLGDRTAPVRSLLDLSAATRFLREPKLLDRGGWLGRADVEMVLQVDAWLRRLRVRMCI
jgi:asparagine synthase (glutamine-hydrolysing)